MVGTQSPIRCVLPSIGLSWRFRHRIWLASQPLRHYSKTFHSNQTTRAYHHFLLSQALPNVASNWYLSRSNLFVNRIDWLTRELLDFANYSLAEISSLIVRRAYISRDSSIFTFRNLNSTLLKSVAALAKLVAFRLPIWPISLLSFTWNLYSFILRTGWLKDFYSGQKKILQR